MTTNAPSISEKSTAVLATPAAEPHEANRFFSAKLGYETDPSDVHYDLHNGAGAGFVVIDARSTPVYAQCYLPGAVSLPYRTINQETTARFSKDTLPVVYCWGPACNAATRAAVRLTALGFQAKEMIGGIEYWRREGFAVEGDDVENAPLVG